MVQVLVVIEWLFFNVLRNRLQVLGQLLFSLLLLCLPSRLLFLLLAYPQEGLHALLEMRLCVAIANELGRQPHTYLLPYSLFLLLSLDSLLLGQFAPLLGFALAFGALFELMATLELPVCAL